MIRKISNWIRQEILEDELEMAAVVSFGIGFPLALGVLAVTLYLLSFV